MDYAAAPLWISFTKGRLKTGYGILFLISKYYFNKIDIH